MVHARRNWSLGISLEREMKGQDKNPSLKSHEERMKPIRLSVGMRLIKMRLTIGLAMRLTHPGIDMVDLGLSLVLSVGVLAKRGLAMRWA